MKSILAPLKGRTLTTLAFGVLIIVVWAWWLSSRYSERHLLYVGAGTVEIFSASSLLRVSLVPGRVGDFGGKTFYRQKNARGKMKFRPAFPKFAKRSGIFEVTFGYWHLGVMATIALVSAGCVEIGNQRRLRLRGAGAEGRN